MAWSSSHVKDRHTRAWPARKALASSLAWYSDVPGMLGTNHSSRIARSAVAACISFLLSFASLASLAINVYGDTARSCCRGRFKCCCKRAGSNPSSGPAFANQTCSDGCGQIALGATSISGVVRPSTNTLTPPFEFAARISALYSTPHPRLSDDVRRQRPPPTTSA